MSSQKKGQDAFWGARLALWVLGDIPGRLSREACVLYLVWQVCVSGMLLLGPFCEVLLQSEVLIEVICMCSMETFLFSLKVTNLGSIFQLFLHMHLCQCLLLTFTSPSFFQVSTESVFL